MSSEFGRTIEAIRDVNLQLNIAEQHRKGHREVALCPESDVPIAGLQVLEGKDSLPQHLVVVIIHGEPEHSKFRKDNLMKEAVCVNLLIRGWSWSRCTCLSEQEWLLIIDGIETVVWHHFGPVLFSDGVSWETVHVHFDVSSNLSVR